MGANTILARTPAAALEIAIRSKDAVQPPLAETR